MFERDFINYFSSQSNFRSLIVKILGISGTHNTGNSCSKKSEIFDASAHTYITGEGFARDPMMDKTGVYEYNLIAGMPRSTAASNRCGVSFHHTYECCG